MEIEECCVSNPNSFWDHIKKLGPRKKSEIPWEVRDGDKVTHDRETVLNVWKDTFESLYKTSNNEFDESFQRQCEEELMEHVV